VGRLTAPDSAPLFSAVLAAPSAPFPVILVHPPVPRHALTAGFCLSLEDAHLDVEDDTAQNHFQLLWFSELMLILPMNYNGVGR
jgi:hypothetical protein